MKRLSDYKDEEAIELWAKMLAPIVNIFSDEEVRKSISGGKSVLEKAQTILLTHKKDAASLILAIDPTPITGLNLITRFTDILLEIENSEEFRDFFGSRRTGMMENESSGFVTENTGAGEK